MVRYGPWTYDESSKRHWCDVFDDYNSWVERIWSGGEDASEPRSEHDVSQQPESQAASRADQGRYASAALPLHQAQSGLPASPYDSSYAAPNARGQYPQDRISIAQTQSKYQSSDTHHPYQGATSYPPHAGRSRSYLPQGSPPHTISPQSHSQFPHGGTTYPYSAQPYPNWSRTGAPNQHPTVSHLASQTRPQYLEPSQSPYSSHQYPSVNPSYAPTQGPAQPMSSSYWGTSNQKSSHARVDSIQTPHSSTSQFPHSLQTTSPPHRVQSTESAQPELSSLPMTVQRSVGGDLPERLIRTGTDPQNEEVLDPRYRRVKGKSITDFFVPGRVFKMLWTEPAGPVELGKSRRGTHFSISEVRFKEYAHSEIRRYVVIRNCGTFSQCIPIHTYHGRGALKPGIQAHLHGVIHTDYEVPALLPDEEKLIFKQAVRVIANSGEKLEPESRINYGKPYAVEHNVKVLDIGMVWEDHVHLILAYFTNAVTKGE